MIIIRQEQITAIQGGRVHRSYDEEFGVFGLRRHEDMQINLKENGDLIHSCLVAWNANIPTDIRIIVDGCVMECKAFITEVTTGDDPFIKLRLTGPSRIINMEEKKMKKTKVLNRFYVASDKMLSEAEQGSVNAGPQHSANEYYDGGGFERGRSRPRHTRWAKRDLSQAIDHARDILDNDPSKSEVAIVRIVKMVRRKATPIVVEDVK